MTSDQVCEKYAEAGVKITLKLLEEEDGFVLVEGDADALEFLGQLILSVAREDRGCSRQLGPKAPGSAFFTESSTKGIYIHRLPCEHSQG